MEYHLMCDHWYINYHSLFRYNTCCCRPKQDLSSGLEVMDPNRSVESFIRKTICDQANARCLTCGIPYRSPKSYIQVNQIPQVPEEESKLSCSGLWRQGGHVRPQDTLWTGHVVRQQIWEALVDQVPWVINSLVVTLNNLSNLIVLDSNIEVVPTV